MGTKRIRVAVVDNLPVVRTGLAIVLNAFDDFELIGQASDGIEAIALCTRESPDVVLMDLVMPGMDGIAATQIIHQANPNIRVIILSGFGREDLAKAALQAGATSYLLKNVTGQDLAKAVRAAYAESQAST
jgi:DNA-binding NarL/FixJ family response regulator